MARWRQLHLVALSLLFAVGCGGSSPSSPDPVASVVGAWILQAFELSDGSSIPVAPGDYTANFQANGQLSLKVDCNSCSGNYTESSGSLSIGERMACTLVACPQGSLEFDYLAAIRTTSSFERTETELLLRYEGGSLRFQAE